MIEYINLTPRERSIRLFGQYYGRIEHTLSEEYSPHEKFITKQCTLITINEIIYVLKNDIKDIYVNNNKISNMIKYWEDVREELENI